MNFIVFFPISKNPYKSNLQIFKYHIYIYIYFSPGRLHRLANRNGWWHLCLQFAGVHVRLGSWFGSWVPIKMLFNEMWSKYDLTLGYMKIFDGMWMLYLGFPWWIIPGTYIWRIWCIYSSRDGWSLRRICCIWRVPVMDHPWDMLYLGFPWWIIPGTYMLYWGFLWWIMPGTYMLYLLLIIDASQTPIHLLVYHLGESIEDIPNLFRGKVLGWSPQTWGHLYMKRDWQSVLNKCFHWPKRFETLHFSHNFTFPHSLWTALMGRHVFCSVGFTMTTWC